MDWNKWSIKRSDIRFKTTTLKSTLCDYSDECIHVKVRIKITGAGGDAASRRADERNKGVIFKNCSPFINCKSEIDNSEIDNAKDIDIVIPTYNLIEYSDNYLNISGSLWKYCKEKPNINLADSDPFKSKKNNSKTSCWR